MDKILGERIKSIRKKHRVTQREFAELLGVAQSAVSKIEKGYQPPSVDILISLREELDINLNKLLVQ